MPNLVPPVTSVEQARDYRDRIVSLVQDGSRFTPLMTLYLTDETNEDTVREARQSGFIKAFKLYPAGATTNSEAGVNTIQNLFPIFAAMEKQGMPLAVHGEVTDEDVDIFDREAEFIGQQLSPIIESFPDLRVIFEHITTREAVDFVIQAPQTVAATITAHHLLFNRNDLLAGGVKPVYYCLPILKRSQHQMALLSAATSGNAKFFLGTDSAPHPRHAKENACGCAAGCYTAHAAIELYAEAFDAAGKLDNLEAFSSHNGPDFYQIPRNEDTITLTEEGWRAPDSLTFGQDDLVPIRTGEEIRWTVKDFD
jgi:dihydroorotase